MVKDKKELPVYGASNCRELLSPLRLGYGNKRIRLVLLTFRRLVLGVCITLEGEVLAIWHACFQEVLIRPREKTATEIAAAT